MMLKPAYSIDDLSLEEVFRDLKLAALAYKKIRRWNWLKNFYIHFLPKSSHIKLKEKQLNDHLLKELLPTAKSLSYFRIIHCEPKEIYFCNLGENKFATHSMFSINIQKDDFDDDIVPSALSHEIVHTFSPGADESVTTILGCEIDARMILLGHKIHQISLCKLLRNLVRHVVYLKAEQVGQIAKWKDFIKSLEPNLMTEDYLAELIDDYENGGVFGKVSDYTLLPYLSIKTAIKNNIDFAIDEFRFFGSLKREKVEIPTLIQIWKELIENRKEK
ncbi:MAG: hypothetical protein COV69_02620 [Parcubacteria group bacterium CG11_big_fil_rev_8_21_14_0_20_39_14]|nr:MAG: hypothetical protein COV69_02620 [Parcubacteria group bacterium CG11_big_fil_rev_8_21_14_0_20_39_14]